MLLFQVNHIFFIQCVLVYADNRGPPLFSVGAVCGVLKRHYLLETEEKTFRGPDVAICG